MKGFIIFLTCIFCYGNNSFITDKNPIINLIANQDIIKKIQSDFLGINKHLSHYRKKTKDASEMSSEGGILTGYYDKNMLKKIHCTFYGEMGKTETDYYFNNKELFFLYRKEIFYDKPMYLKGFKIKNTIETRYYMHDHIVIKSIVEPNTSTILSYNEIGKGLKPVLAILNAK